MSLPGGYCIGIHGLFTSANGDRIPRCLFVVSSEVSGMKLPWFWLFSNRMVALLQGLCWCLDRGVHLILRLRSRVTGVMLMIPRRSTLRLVKFFGATTCAGFAALNAVWTTYAGDVRISDA